MTIDRGDAEHLRDLHYEILFHGMVCGESHNPHELHAWIESLASEADLFAREATMRGIAVDDGDGLDEISGTGMREPFVVDLRRAEAAGHDGLKCERGVFHVDGVPVRIPVGAAKDHDWEIVEVAPNGRRAVHAHGPGAAHRKLEETEYDRRCESARRRTRNP